MIPFAVGLKIQAIGTLIFEKLFMVSQSIFKYLMRVSVNLLVC